MTNSKEVLTMLKRKVIEIEKSRKYLKLRIEELKIKNNNLHQKIKEYDEVMKKYSNHNKFSIAIVLAIETVLLTCGFTGIFNIETEKAFTMWIASTLILPILSTPIFILRKNRFIRKYNFKDSKNLESRKKELEEEIKNNEEIIDNYIKQIRIYSDQILEIENTRNSILGRGTITKKEINYVPIKKENNDDNENTLKLKKN